MFGFRVGALFGACLLAWGAFAVSLFQSPVWIVVGLGLLAVSATSLLKSGGEQTAALSYLLGLMCAAFALADFTGPGMVPYHLAGLGWLVLGYIGVLSASRREQSSNRGAPRVYGEAELAAEELTEAEQAELTAALIAAAAPVADPAPITAAPVVAAPEPAPESVRPRKRTVRQKPEATSAPSEPVRPVRRRKKADPPPAPATPPRRPRKPKKP